MQQTWFELFLSTFAANNEVLVFAAIQVELWAAAEEVKLDAEPHHDITGLYPLYDALQCAASPLEVSKLCQWHPTAK